MKQLKSFCRWSVMIVLCLLTKTGGANGELLSGVEVYAKFTQKAPLNCAQALAKTDLHVVAGVQNCAPLRGAINVFRLSWSAVRESAVRAHLTLLKSNDEIQWFEFRGQGLSLQSLIPSPTVLSQTLDYSFTLKAAKSEATDPVFVDDTTLRIRSLLNIYPPQNLVTVAVIDSGVNFNSKLLAGMGWVNSREVSGNSVDDDSNGYIDDSLGWDFVNDMQDPDNDPADPLGHGTAVASIIAATAGANASRWLRIMPLRVASGNSGFGIVSPFDLAEAIHYAVNNGAQLINLSVGSVQTFDIVREAIEYALSKGVKLVVSAGNTSNEVLFPANLPGVIAVGALDKQGRIWSGSAQGSNVDVYYPGTDMLAGLWSNFASLSSNGTSYAAPIATGQSAMMFALIGAGNECAASRSMLLGYRPISQLGTAWGVALLNRFEADVKMNLNLESAWQQKHLVCGAQITLSALLRRPQK